nr:ubinuclein-1-like [Leptinotarsa decemlineata]
MMKSEVNMFKPPEPLILNEDSNASYRKFKQKFMIYMRATNYIMEKDDRKIAILLNVGGEVVIDIYNALELSEEQKQNYETVMIAFDNYFMPKKNELLSRYLFNIRKQLEGEMLKDFIRELRDLAEPCNFGHQKESLIRDQVILGISNDQLRNNLLSLRTLTLEQMEQICNASELKKNQVKQEVDEYSILNGVGCFHQAPNINIECIPELMEIEKQEPFQLPEGLPPTVLNLMDDLRRAGENYKGDNKKDFFTEEVNLNLLRLWEEIKLLNKSLKPKIYEYLSQYVNISKDTLIRRSKGLRLSEEEKKLAKLRNELKMLIDQQMPALEMGFRKRCDDFLKQKFAKDKDDGQIKSQRTPRRQYHWNEQSRCVLRSYVIYTYDHNFEYVR